MTKRKEPCVHHWVLEAEGGHEVPGKCQKCGAKKKFSGFISYGADTMKRINQMNALENEKKKQVRVGIHLPGSPLPRAGEQAW